MKFMGSKRRIAKEILAIIEPQIQGRLYVEPFVGGGNMIEKVKVTKKIGSDIDADVVAALTLIKMRPDALPKDSNEFTEEDYRNRCAGKWESIKSFAAFAYSYAAKKWGGWRRSKCGRDYVSEAFRNAQKQSPLLSDVTLLNVDYRDLELPEPAVIYCDPPYANTTKYSSSFNHDEFWQWCRDMTVQGHKVFVSEYSAPEDFKEVWSKALNSSLTQDTGSKKGVEKLFTYEVRDEHKD